jgi:transcriptional regulator with XRE-family HTH domain
MSETKPERNLPSLGRMIRRYRQRSELTQTALAAEAGVTKGFLSQVEHDVAAPRIDTLRRIAAALDIPIFYLFPDAHRSNGVVRRNERKIIRPSPVDVSYELLSPDLKGDIEMIRMVLPPGAISVKQPIRHPGEEVSFVVKGRVTVRVGTVAHALETGDSLRFNCSIPHQVVNDGDSEAEIIAAITPPRF